jgi:ribosomal protein L37E
MRNKTQAVNGPIMQARCRRCGIVLINFPDTPDMTQGPLFRVGRMYANPNDPAFTYVCRRCDEILETGRDD